MADSERVEARREPFPIHRVSASVRARASRAQRRDGGLHIDPATRADAKEWVAGRIGVDELVARGRARYDLH